ncbi:sigma 54-interacting transcriptional regulator [Flammeovirga sp. MY04]|uniref:sigma 54-interacting transcriptional regulator n=1 Tax=Flammeovirga sp. MY04 TaxID=1191459 RepID=UPI0009FBC465|nr:sigma 54-interacting transcriptional regulator [Flammeovirga sp. MY04]ANQ49859.2 sigma 54-interacting transcriptional regulator [Flammeovirga sp. MY04]
MLDLYGINFILAGIFFTLSVLYLCIYLITDRDILKLIYGLMSGSSGAFILLSTYTHSLFDLDEHQQFSTYMLVTYMFLMMMIFRAAYELSERIFRKTYLYLTFLSILIILFMFFFGNYFMYTDKVLVKSIQLASEKYYYLKGEPQNLFFFLTTIFYLSCIYYFSRLVIRSIQSKSPRKIVISSSVSILFIFSNIYDVFIDIGTIKGIFLTEYAVTGIVMLLSIDLLLSFYLGYQKQVSLNIITKSFEEMILNIDLYVFRYDDNGNITFFNKFSEKELSFDNNNLYRPIKEFFNIEEKEEDDLNFRLTVKGPNYKVIEGTRVTVNLSSHSRESYMIGYEITQRLTHQKKLTETLDELQKVSKQLEEENTFLKETKFRGKNKPSVLVIDHNFSMSVESEIKRIANYKSTVLIHGNEGAGKTYIANQIIKYGDRAEKPQILYNCHSTLKSVFNTKYYEDSVYTQGYNKSILDVANGGSLVLENIHYLSDDDQIYLLDLLKQLDESDDQKYDVRFIATTDQNLRKLAEEGKFNLELYHFLSIYRIHLPDLKRRLSDIPYLVEVFVESYCKKNNIPQFKVSIATIKKLQAYHWPENIKELKYIIQRSINNSKGKTLKLFQFEEYVEDHREGNSEYLSLDQQEKKYILKVLKHCNWKVSGKNSASELLKINEATLRSKMKKLDIKKV